MPCLNPRKDGANPTGTSVLLINTLNIPVTPYIYIHTYIYIGLHIYMVFLGCSYMPTYNKDLL